MKLTAYLSPSRHGIFYFRWPLPRAEDHKRQTIKISLRTRCPDRAGDTKNEVAKPTNDCHRARELSLVISDKGAISTLINLSFIVSFDT